MRRKQSSTVSNAGIPETNESPDATCTRSTLFPRRSFLRNSALTIAGTAALPSWLGRAAMGSEGGGNGKKILVAIFLRGAADGLNIVVPFAEPHYYDLRPTIAVPRPGETGGAIDLNGSFGLHPSLASLKALYDEKHLAIIEATGSPDPTRSHFDAQDYMESGTPGRKGTPDGWLNRALDPTSAGGSPVRAIALGKQLPRTLRGSNPAIALSDIGSFRVRNRVAAGIFEAMYEESPDEELRAVGAETFEAIKLLQSVENQNSTGGDRSEYPKGALGPSLQQIAALIKADVGVEAAFTDMGGWDHHTNESQQLANMLRQLGDALTAFYHDLGGRMENVVLVTMSEFGRTARENGSLGTDHGHGSLMFVMGGSVNGGKIYGSWPGLETEQLYEERDLAVTTDFRDVLSELAAKGLGAGSGGAAAAFPDYEPQSVLGLL